MVYQVARQWRMILSAVILLGLAVFAMAKGVSVLAQDSTSNSVQPRQTVQAPATGTAQRQVAPDPSSAQGAPEAEPTPLPPTGTTYHTVQAGESLGKIAARYGVTTAALANANGISNPDLIRVGQKLIVPAR